jgi:hypothetical protein
MSVDPSKAREILVVHGVQTETDAQLDQHKLIQALVASRLNGIPVSFTTDIYGYENINDEAQAKLTKLLSSVGKALLDKIPLGNVILSAGESVIDLLGDVVIALQNTSTAATIRNGLCQRIMQTYTTTGAPLYVVAHSLGSVYALDAINQLMRERPQGVFDRNSRKTWPVQGLVTLGSPLGLQMFGSGRSLAPLGVGRKWFRWFNYWCRTDPIVSASFYGHPVLGYEIAERYLRAEPQQGWVVHDRVVDAGHAWLPAHVSYWNYAPLGDDLVTFISS